MFADGKDAITKESLDGVMKQLGFRPSPAELQQMLESATEGGRKITFSEYVSMMGDKMNSMDAPGAIIEAFESFDAEVTGNISHDTFKNIMAMGKSGKFTDREIREFIKMADAGEGKFDYVALVKQITTGN